jgi:HSP20 family molecular chaperone IbpA
MPGVKADDLTIDLRDNTLTLSADIAPVDNTDEEEILVEYETGRYYRQFTLGELINQEKIDAKLNDGVLRLTLPKVEKVTPKKIAVKTG